MFTCKQLERMSAAEMECHYCTDRFPRVNWPRHVQEKHPETTRGKKASKRAIAAKAERAE